MWVVVGWPAGLRISCAHLRVSLAVIQRQPWLAWLLLLPLLFLVACTGGGGRPALTPTPSDTGTGGAAGPAAPAGVPDTPGTPAPVRAGGTGADGALARTGTEAGGTGGGAPAPTVAGDTGAREGCRPGEVQRGPLLPRGPVSPVRARAYLKEDPGVAAPILANLSELPVTIVVEFDGPVVPETFGLAVVDRRCDYEPGPVEQEVRWVSDRQAEVTLRALPYGKPGPYGLTLGRGRDREGREVEEPNLSFVLGPAPLIQVYALPLAGGEPRLLWQRRVTLEPRSVSPDGRYLLLARRLDASSSGHSRIRIPYVADLKTGDLRAYSRGQVDQVPRWDLPARAVWVSGWQRLALDGSGDTGTTVLHRLPGGAGGLLAAQVSPDGRWLAAVRTPVRARGDGKADLIRVNLETGEARVEPGAVGYLEAENGPPWVGLEWAGPSLLVTSYESPRAGKPHVLRYDPATGSRQVLPIPARPGSLTSWAPGGAWVAVSGTGVFRSDGTRLPVDPQVLPGNWPPLWSADGRWLLGYRQGVGHMAVEVGTGREHVLPVPPELWGLIPAGLAADGQTVYLVGYR